MFLHQKYVIIHFANVLKDKESGRECVVILNGVLREPQKVSDITPLYGLYL